MFGSNLLHRLLSESIHQCSLMRMHLFLHNLQLILYQSILLRLIQCPLTYYHRKGPNRLCCLLWLLVLLARPHQGILRIRMRIYLFKTLRNYCASHRLFHMSGSRIDRTQSHTNLCHGKMCCLSSKISLNRPYPIFAKVFLAPEGAKLPFSWNPHRLWV